jgi:cation-transporting P-type ATPase 13A2
MILVPSDYDEQLAYYTHNGYRVIACATKHIPKLSWVKAQKMKRHEVENNLSFVGFIIFENKLKPSTAPVLRELLSANIRAIMVTGDNILTAISVARECNLLNKNAHCFVPRFVDGKLFCLLACSSITWLIKIPLGNSKNANAQLQWESIDNPAYQLDAQTLLVSFAPAKSPLRG